MPRISEATIASHDIRPIDEIVHRAQQGDVDAFEVIYRRTSPAVFALCRRMLADERDARDRVQDTFVRAWERLPSYKSQSSLATWLHRVAVNVVLEHLRSTKRDAARLIEGDDDSFGSRAADSPEDASMDLETALQRLPRGARTVFVLSLEGYSCDEIAQLIGIAPGTVRAQLWRARRALAKVLLND